MYTIKANLSAGVDLPQQIHCYTTELLIRDVQLVMQRNKQY